MSTAGTSSCPQTFQSGVEMDKTILWRFIIHYRILYLSKYLMIYEMKRTDKAVTRAELVMTYFYSLHVFY